MNGLVGGCDGRCRALTGKILFELLLFWFVSMIFFDFFDFLSFVQRSVFFVFWGLFRFDCGKFS